MSPTVHAGEQVVFNKTGTFAQGDVVALTQAPGINHQIISRVIGLPGDVVGCPPDNSGKCSAVQVNGVALSENYVVFDRQPFDAIKVGAGEVFVLGDNRKAAVDSRIFGAVPSNSILGIGVAVVDTSGNTEPIPGTPTHESPTGQIDPAGTPPPADSVSNPKEGP
jgi:signal peptidase I